MKIAVLGSAGSSVGRAPFKDAKYHEWTQGKVEYIQQAHDSVPGDWDIWGCSPGCWAVVPRATRWFEVHRWEAGVAWFSPEYVEFLRRFKGPVYTGGAVPEIEGHVVYPLDRMEEKFSSYFMTSSLALMIALAIDEIETIRSLRNAASGDKEKFHFFLEQSFNLTWHGIELVDEFDKTANDDVIGLWGVDMAAADEYAYQRPGCQFFVLEAMRRGIGVYLPPESDLMRPQPVYGISEWDHNYIKLTSRARELNGKAQEMQKQMAEAQQMLQGLQGEQHALQAFVSTWTSPYGMLPGMIIRQAEGTGLGSGITHFDGRPVSRMGIAPSEPVLQAMTESPEAQRAKAAFAEITLPLDAYAVETGLVALTRRGLLDQVLIESRTGRQLSAILQPFVNVGEGTDEALKRILKGSGMGKQQKPMKAARPNKRRR